MVDEKLNLHQRLLAVRSEVSYAKKDKKSNADGKFPYVSSSQILSLIGPALIAAGVLLSTRILKTEVSDHTTAKGGHQYFTQIWTEHTWTNVDKPEDKMVCEWYGQGLDPGEKGVGKAVTYAEKYFLLKFFNIATGEDDDPDSGTSDKGANGNSQQQGPAMMAKSQSSKIQELAAKLYGSEFIPQLKEFVKKETGGGSAQVTETQAKELISKLGALVEEKHSRPEEPNTNDEIPF